MNDNLQHLDSRLKGNELLLDVAKTQSMLIAAIPKHWKLKNAADKFYLKIHGSKLDVVYKSKYFSTHVDNSLDCNEHIKAVSTKVTRYVGFLKHAMCILPIASLKHL